MAVVEVFRALGDPNRLEMIKRLSSGNPYTINSVTQGLEITRQGARKHLQILADADLIILKSKGRDTSVVLNQKRLDEGKAFIEEMERQWDLRLDALRRVVESE
jgi:DNA-binding transcriptional ArsR family regulator